jgi:uncharacterized membrane protein (DUF373 family)
MELKKPYPGGRFVKKFEFGVVVAVGILLILSVTIAIFFMYLLFVTRIQANLLAIHNVVEMQGEIQRVFSGVLLVLLGLELIETLKTYFLEEYIRIEVILIVAMIAVGRHILNMDMEHSGGPVLLGVALLMLALAVSYYLIKRTHLKSGLTDQATPNSQNAPDAPDAPNATNAPNAPLSSPQNP